MVQVSNSPFILLNPSVTFCNKPDEVLNASLIHSKDFLLSFILVEVVSITSFTLSYDCFTSSYHFLISLTVFLFSDISSLNQSILVLVIFNQVVKLSNKSTVIVYKLLNLFWNNLSHCILLFLKFRLTKKYKMKTTISNNKNF